MSKVKTRVQKTLEIAFSSNKLKHTNNGFKLNVIELRKNEIIALNSINSLAFSVSVKRSGTGLVIIVVLFPEDREVIKFLTKTNHET